MPDDTLQGINSQQLEGAMCDVILMPGTAPPRALGGHPTRDYSYEYEQYELRLLST
jgi:hypothetical protein